MHNLKLLCSNGKQVNMLIKASITFEVSIFSFDTIDTGVEYDFNTFYIFILSVSISY